MGSKKITKMVERKGAESSLVKSYKPGDQEKPVWLWRADHLRKRWEEDLECHLESWQQNLLVQFYSSPSLLFMRIFSLKKLP